MIIPMNPRKIVKTLIPTSLFKKIEPYGHLGEAVLFNTINGFPAKGLKVIGVTGTNGKTSTCFLLHRMLREAGYNVGLSTTVSYGVNEDIRPQLHHMTTVSVPELMRRIKWMKQQGAEWLILETTSHALAQNRVWGIPYSVAVMTNITHEHIAFHGTFERYVQAKRKLFTLTNKNRKGLRVGVINAEDPSAELFASAIANSITYGLKKGDLQATNLKLTSGGSRYVAKIEEDEYHIECHLPGSFNVSNSLAAVGVGYALGLTKEQIEKGIAGLEGVEGRMTRIDEGQDFDVVVDYAHTPDSFEKLFADLKPIVKGKIITLFGSLGGGDLGKRPLQGEIAGRYADVVILSQEDDRLEDPQKILEDIAAGAEKAGKVRDNDLFLIHDRVEGIQYAMNQARKGDLVLLLGKGHEKTQEDATGEHPWDEINTARQALKNRK
jgi:UDP-N-acetylmuramoyl-L-alanyl-D-glutamate--2,6-diaminopimelate ligase